MRVLVPVLMLVCASCSAEPRPPSPASSSAAATTGAASTKVYQNDPVPLASSSAPPAPAPDPAVVAQIVAPPGLEKDAKVPFVLFLHGLGGTGKSFASALGVEKLAAEKKFFWASPDGTMDKKQRRFWNASTACCDFDATGVDHVAALGAFIREARRTPGVDPARVFVIGFSNGAFMAHRLGCEVPGIAGIVSVAGAIGEGDPPCAPKRPVAVLEIHGDADKAVRFDGGHVLDMTEVPVHRSVEETMGVWIAADHCTGGAEEKGSLDLMPGLAGAETRDLRYAGCQAPVALWRVTGGDHFIATSRAALDRVFAFLAELPNNTDSSASAP